MPNCNNTGPWAEEPDYDAPRIARDRPQAHRVKEAHWVNVDRALEIEGTTDPTRLRMELKQGLPCRFQDRTRWWRWKSIEDVAPLLAGRNPLDLQDDRRELVIHEKFWRERLGKAVASTSSADVPLIVTDTTINPVEPSPPSIQLRPAPETEIRMQSRRNTKRQKKPVGNPQTSTNCRLRCKSA
jgi:hypothetical protein